MADTFGPLSLPPQAPGAGEAAGDPLLSTLLSFFKATLNGACTAAWNAAGVAPTIPVVVNTYAYDPDTHPFIASQLPALYLWREGGGGAEWLAEDWVLERDKLTLLWVLEPAQPETAAARASFVNAIAKQAVAAIDLGRNPSWIVPGDMDPASAVQGSLLPTYAKYFSLEVSRWRNSKIVVRGGGRSEPYPTCEFQLEVVERDTIDTNDPSHGGDDLTGLDLTLETADVPPLVNDHSIIT